MHRLQRSAACGLQQVNFVHTRSTKLIVLFHHAFIYAAIGMFSEEQTHSRTGSNALVADLGWVKAKGTFPSTILTDFSQKFPSEVVGDELGPA